MSGPELYLKEGSSNELTRVNGTVFLKNKSAVAVIYKDGDAQLLVSGCMNTFDENDMVEIGNACKALNDPSAGK
jgi:hypothetical protein